MRTDTPYNINDLFGIKVEDYSNYVYKAVSYHRNGTAHKSQWIIGVDEEIGLFVYAITANSIGECRGWALYIKDGVRNVVGLTIDREESYIGVFERSTELEWHGYPGDYKRSDKDIPHTTILQNWKNNGYITKSHMSHIQHQQPCNL